LPGGLWEKKRGGGIDERGKGVSVRYLGRGLIPRVRQKARGKDCQVLVRLLLAIKGAEYQRKAPKEENTDRQYLAYWAAMRGRTTYRPLQWPSTAKIILKNTQIGITEKLLRPGHEEVLLRRQCKVNDQCVTDQELPSRKTAKKNQKENTRKSQPEEGS